MLLDNFVTEMNRTFSSYILLDTLDANFNPDQGFSITASVTDKKCAFYEGSAAEHFVSDRYKDKLTGVIICKPDVTVSDDSKLILDNGFEYIVLHADDVMYQGEVMVIALRNEDYGVAING